MEIKLAITICLLFSTALSGLLAIYGASHLRTSGAKPFIALMGSATVYCFGYALEINQSTLEGIVFALRIEYLGISFLPVFWLLLALWYAGYGHVVPRWLYYLLFFIPVMTLLLFYTNAHHHLYYSALSLNTSGPFPLAKISKGIWYHLNMFYTTACFFAGNLIVLRMLLRSAGKTRKQAATMFAASILPWVGDSIYQAGLSPYSIDLTPFTFAFTGPLFALGLFRFRLFDFVPIARHTVFEYIKDPVLVLDGLNRLEDFNKAAADIFVFLSPEALGRNVRDVFDPQPELLRHLERESVVSEEIRLRCDNAAHVFELSMLPLSVKRVGTVGRIVILHEITRQKQLLEQLREQAIRDGLTGIYNHRYFMEAGNAAIREMIHHNQAASLILADLDYFKRINDSYGHLAGDEALRRTARVFQEKIRSGDILGRYGGEEFVVLLPRTLPEEAVAIAERLRAALAAREVVMEEQKIQITGSFGVFGSSVIRPGFTLEIMCKKADDALYLAKERGRNRVALFSPDSPESEDASESEKE